MEEEVRKICGIENGEDLEKKWNVHKHPEVSPERNNKFQMKMFSFLQLNVIVSFHQISSFDRNLNSIKYKSMYVVRMHARTHAIACKHNHSIQKLHHQLTSSSSSYHLARTLSLFSRPKYMIWLNRFCCFSTVSNYRYHYYHFRRKKSTKIEKGKKLFNGKKRTYIHIERWRENAQLKNQSKNEEEAAAEAEAQ